MSYRLQRIEVKSHGALNRIAFFYDDGQTWSVGNKYGLPDHKVVILHKDEYLVRVTHEQYKQVRQEQLRRGQQSFSVVYSDQRMDAAHPVCWSNMLLNISPLFCFILKRKREK